MRRIIIAVTLVAACAVSLTITGAAGADMLSRDQIGTGENLIFVVGGEYPTLLEAQMATERFSFGEVEGFYILQSALLEGELPGRYLLASAFRTDLGATEFEELAAAAGATTRRITARYTGTEFVGLGQEPHPDGSGPLTAPLTGFTME